MSEGKKGENKTGAKFPQYTFFTFKFANFDCNYKPAFLKSETTLKTSLWNMNAHDSNTVQNGYFQHTGKGHSQGQKVINLGVIWKGFKSIHAKYMYEVSIFYFWKVTIKVFLRKES